MSELLIWSISALMVLAGCWLQSALGFGLAIVAAPIIVLIKPEWVPVMLTVVALPLSAMNVWQLRHHIQLRMMAVPIVARVPGTVIGVWLLMTLNVQWLQISVATAVLMAVVISFWGRKFEVTRGRLAWAGLVSGVMGSTTAVGGPPLALVMQHGEPYRIRANLSLYFMCSCLLSLAGYSVGGILNSELLWQSLSFVPISVLGLMLGTRSRGYIDGGRFRPILMWLCGVAGTVALVGAIWGGI
ncbi:sulfite exporter TauE/SafE family protein [Corallincola spongiicola]|nr:sulfite exporter TauE/SafE family protein [Corallincola spongiicola]